MRQSLKHKRSVLLAGSTLFILLQHSGDPLCQFLCHGGMTGLGQVHVVDFVEFAA